MKTSLSSPSRMRLPALAAALLIGALLGCSKTENTPPPSTPAPEPAKPVTTAAAAAVGQAWDKTKETAKKEVFDAKQATSDGVAKLDNATYDERMAVKSSLEAAGAKLEDELAMWAAELETNGKGASAKSRRKLSEAQEAFAKSLDELGSASANGWETAKAKTAAAWSELKAGYDQVKADHVAT